MIDKVRSSFLATITSRNNHLSTGMFGTPWLFKALASLNRSDIAWKILSQTDFPSYGYMLQENATTLWESWGFSNDTLSHNHPMFSGAVPWILGSIGGTQIDEANSVAGDRLIFAPLRPAGSDLTHSKATVTTSRGTASCSWRCSQGGMFHVNISCPVNTKGTVVIHGIPPFVITGGNYQFSFPTNQCPTTGADAISESA